MGLYVASLVPAGAEVFIVTENTKHFPPRFGDIRIVDALRFLQALGSHRSG
jgi:hypothetical protein